MSFSHTLARSLPPAPAPALTFVSKIFQLIIYSPVILWKSEARPLFAVLVRWFLFGFGSKQESCLSADAPHFVHVDINCLIVCSEYSIFVRA